jgi:isochorismate synthase
VSIDDWTGYIESILGEISAGNFDKIVAARRCAIQLSQRIDPALVFRRLVERYPQCTQFLFSRGPWRFVGATPETLFVKQGDRIETQALAGTRRARSVAGDSSGLLASKKDLEEHNFVVREIRERLDPLCVRLHCARQPEIRQVGEILHMNTGISGQLRPSVNALDLLARLHPTPAIGGAPQEAAAEWIADHESAPRGWFAGAVGWLDAAGDAAFSVAIRCGLLSDSRAFAFAGAGIVRNSEASSEYAETGLKMRPLLGALGVAWDD